MTFFTYVNAVLREMCGSFRKASTCFDWWTNVLSEKLIVVSKIHTTIQAYLTIAAVCVYIWAFTVMYNVVILTNQ